DDGLRDFPVTGVQTCALTSLLHLLGGRLSGGAGALQAPTELCRVGRFQRSLRGEEQSGADHRNDQQHEPEAGFSAALEHLARRVEDVDEIFPERRLSGRWGFLYGGVGHLTVR